MLPRAEVIDFMKIAQSLPKEQQQFITEVLTICNDNGIRPDDAWNAICKRYCIPTTQELDMIYQKQHGNVKM